jgi:hypothetical protein
MEAKYNSQLVLTVSHYHIITTCPALADHIIIEFAIGGLHLVFS